MIDTHDYIIVPEHSSSLTRGIWPPRTMGTISAGPEAA